MVIDMLLTSNQYIIILIISTLLELLTMKRKVGYCGVYCRSKPNIWYSQKNVVS